ncbi:MAG: protein kinase, partial [Chitinispirillaceae bacterium]|nr:protein kinase [Chitinispirillaceae bacterium]
DVYKRQPLYIAPEQVQEEEIDHRCDIYSAGVVLYEAIAGKLPVQKTTVEGLLNIKINNPETLFTETPSNFCSVIDKNLEKIILKAIEPDKDKRFQNCREFYEELSNYYNQRYKTE